MRNKKNKSILSKSLLMGLALSTVTVTSLSVVTSCSLFKSSENEAPAPDSEAPHPILPPDTTEPSNPSVNSNQAYIDSAKKINSTTVTQKQNSMDRDEFSRITADNLKSYLNLSPTIDFQSELVVTSFQKNSNSITFTLGYIKNGETIKSESITISYTLTSVEPPKPPEIIYAFSVASSAIANIINATSATYHLTLTSNQPIELTKLAVDVRLNNNAYRAAITQGVNSNTYNLEIIFDNLQANTTYDIQGITAIVDSKSYDVPLHSNRYEFTTLKNIDSVTQLILSSKEVTAPTSSISLTLTLDQLSEINTNKQLRVIFSNTNTNELINSEPIRTSKGNLEYNLVINNLSKAGVYKFKEAQVYQSNNWIPIGSSLNQPVQFIFKIIQQNNDLPYSTKPTTEYGNIYNLQQAETLVSTNLNVNTYSEAAMSRNNLNSINPNYGKYFNTLDHMPIPTTHHDKVEDGLTNSTDYDIRRTVVEGNKVRMILNSDKNTNINSLSVLVKSWDNYHQWERLIACTQSSSSNTIWEFNTSELDTNQTQYIITDMVVDNTYHTALDLFDGYMINLEKTSSLSVASFDVFQDSSNKKVYGAITLDWGNNTLNQVYDKVFALDFKVKQKEYRQQTDPFGNVTNGYDKFNVDYAPPTNKKIYVQFKQLAKFSLDGFQEGLTYTLDNVEILNSESYIPYLNPIKTNSDRFKFAYVYDWTMNDIQLINQLYQDTNTPTITKEQLKAQASTSAREFPIEYSLENMNTLLDYNFDLYNVALRYPNAKTPVKNLTKYVIKKNGVRQSLKFFMPSEILSKTIFDISSDKHSATITKNLDSIVGLSTANEDDVILWLTFELDINPRRSVDYVEFNDIQSRIRVPVSLKNLKQFKHIDDVNFMFDAIQGTPTQQQAIFSKIKSNIKFSLDINDTNQLTLTATSRNSDLDFTNEMWTLNTASNRSAMLGTCNLFVNWIQPEDNSTTMLSYREKSKLDDLTIKGSMTVYNDKYNLETTKFGEKIDKKSATNYRLLPEPKPEDVTRRLYQEQSSVGSRSSWNRTFGISDKAGGTWNCFGKVNEDKDDYRFYAMINLHVWETMGDSNNIGYTRTDEHGYSYIMVDSPTIIAPTPYSESNTEKRGPMFNKNEAGITPQGYKMKLTTNPGEGIKIKLFQSNFGEERPLPINKVPQYDDFRNNEGFVETRSKDNNIDMDLVIIDLRCAIEPFVNKDLDKMVYQDRTLTDLEKGAIRHFQQLMNVPPIQFSKLSRHMSSVANYNYYISSMPTWEVNTNPQSAEGRRFRQYIIGNNSAKIIQLIDANGKDVEPKRRDVNRPVFALQDRYNDIQDGSSGTGVYDSEGKIVGIDVKGHPSSASYWFFIDTQKYSYLGDSDIQYNPNTFYRRVKKMSYLYPSLYTDIFKTSK